MERLVDTIYTFKGKVEDVENDYIVNVQEKLKAYEDKQEQGLLIEKAEPDKYKLALFGVIRNSQVMPVGIQQGKSMEEINAMSIKTMEAVIEMCNFDALKQMYEDAEEALAKMGE